MTISSTLWVCLPSAADHDDNHTHANAEDTTGYQEVASDGGLFAFVLPSTDQVELHLISPIVGIACTPDGKGYWLVAADGGVFSFGMLLRRLHGERHSSTHRRLGVRP